jgi:hypothetical protein
LDQVVCGNRILITRHGKPAVILSRPPKEKNKHDVARIVKDMLRWRDENGARLGKIKLRELIHEGRRF